MSTKSIALCRVSTPEQKVEGHSLERQEENVVKASEQLEAPIVRTWSLDQSSRSGKNLKRKDLLEMIEYCKQDKRVKYLIVDEVDRFMRSIDEFYFFEVSFKALEVQVWYASQPELNNGDIMAKFSKLFHIFKAEASNMERQGKSLNGLKARVAGGYWPFPLHQGYKKGTEAGLHIQDTKRFRLLQEAFREVTTRSYTVNEALERLTSKGYKSPSNKPLRIDKFRSLLKDPYYAGALRVKQWDQELWNDKGLHEPIISLEEWEELQLIVDNKMRKFQRKKHNPKYQVSNIIFCSECGEKKLVGYDHRNGKNGWIGEEYRCRGCGKVHKKHTVHEGLDRLLDSVKLPEGNIDQFMKLLREEWLEQQKDNFNLVKQENNRLFKLKGEKAKLAEGVINRPEIAEELLESINKIKLEIKEVEKRASEAENIEGDFIEFVGYSIDYIKNLKLKWWQLEHDDLVECKLLAFKQEIFIDYNGKVYTPEISPILKLIDDIEGAKNTQKSKLVEVAGVAPASKRLKTYFLQV